MEGRIVGDYRLLSKLGEGAAGVVFLATPVVDKDFAKRGEPLAIKVYKPEILKQPGQAKRIEREFNAGKQLAHPNIVRIHDYSLESDPPYLVMEYVDGITLDNLGMMFYPIPEKLLIYIVRQLAKGVRELHSKGIVHRDLKPQNAMVSSSFKLKVMDLGVVQLPTSHGVTRVLRIAEESETSLEAVVDRILELGFWDCRFLWWIVHRGYFRVMRTSPFLAEEFLCFIRPRNQRKTVLRLAKEIGDVIEGREVILFRNEPMAGRFQCARLSDGRIFSMIHSRS